MKRPLFPELVRTLQRAAHIGGTFFKAASYRLPALLLLCAPLSALAQLPEARLSVLTPPGGRAGESIAVTLTGVDLEEAGLKFSHPGIAAAVDPKDPLKFTVTIAANVPPGVYDVRAVGKFGVSNPRCFEVGVLPEVEFSPKATLKRQPQELSLPCVVQGAARGGQTYWFQISAQRGQELAFDCHARRLDSRLDPLMVLLDASGKELTRVHAKTLTWTPTEDGPLFLTLRDFISMGGPEYGFRLYAGAPKDLPVVATETPLVFWPPAAQAKAETEPNDVAHAQKITLPAEIRGEFYPARDIDTFQTEAKKGEVWCLEVLSNRMGFPTNPRLVVQRVVKGAEGAPETLSEVLDGKAEPIAAGDPDFNGQHYDPVARWEVQEDGTYRVTLRDLNNTLDPVHNRQYFLSIRKPLPDFALVCAPLTPVPNKMYTLESNHRVQVRGTNLRPGQVLPVRVFATRRDGFDREIRLSAEGLPPGVTVEASSVGHGQSEGTLLLKASAEVQSWVGDIRILGTGTLAGTPQTRAASTSFPVWENTGAQYFSPIRARFAAAFTLGIIADAPFPTQLTLEPASVEALPTGKVKLTLKLQRAETGTGSVKAKPFGLAGLDKAKDVDVPAKEAQTETEFDLAPLKLAPGNYTLWFRGEEKVKRDVKGTATDVTLVLGSNPVHLSVTPPPPSKAAAPKKDAPPAKDTTSTAGTASTGDSVSNQDASTEDASTEDASAGDASTEDAAPAKAPVKSASNPLPKSGPVSFAKDILPMLEASCLPCHNATKSEGGLVLESPSAMREGGDSGPAIVAKHALDSLLFKTVTGKKKPFMPPDANKAKAPKLTPAEVALLKRWIDEGAIGSAKTRPPVVWKAMPSAIQTLSALAVSGDGNFAAAGQGNRVVLLNLQLQRQVATFEAHPDVIAALAFSPDGNTLATGSQGEVKLWKKVVTPLDAMPTDSVTVSPEAATSVRSPDGKLEAVVVPGKPLQLKGADNGPLIATLTGDVELSERVATARLKVASGTFQLTFAEAELKATREQITKAKDDLEKTQKEHDNLESKRSEFEKELNEATVKRDSVMQTRDAAQDVLVALTQAETEAASVNNFAASELRTAQQKQKGAAEAGEAAKKASSDLAAVRTKKTAAKDAADAREKEYQEAGKRHGDAVTSVALAQAAATRLADLKELSVKLVGTESTQNTALADAKTEYAAAVTALEEVTQLQKSFQLPPAEALAFGENGAVLFTQHKEAGIRAWNTTTGEPMRGADLHAKWVLQRTIGDAAKPNSVFTGRVGALAFSPDGKLLATGSGDPSRSGEIKLWNTASGELVQALSKPHKDAVLALDFSADGRLLASGAADRAVRVWEVPSGKLYRNLEAHSTHVLSVSFRADRRRLASASADNTVKVWDLEKSDVVATVKTFTAEVNYLRYIGGADELMAAGGEPTLKIFQDGGKVIIRDKTEGLTKFVSAAAGTPDGRVQLVGDVAGKLLLFNREGKTLAHWLLKKD